MSDYFQPDFYRFNEDSLLLIEWIKKNVKFCPASILDLGAGSGILGIELANSYQAEFVDFLEIQDDFIFYLTKNIDTFLNKKSKSVIHHDSFSNWKPQRRWDLIVVNPPYYLKGHGELSKDNRRSIARTFIYDNWSDLCTLIGNSLKPQGICCMVIKNDQRILHEILKNLENNQLGLRQMSQNGICFLEIFRLNKD